MSHYSPNIRGCEAVVFKTGFLLWKHDGNSSPWGERFLFNKNRLTITTLLRNFSDASTFHWTDFIPVSLSRFMCVSCMYVSCLILVWGWKYRSNLAFFWTLCVMARVVCVFSFCHDFFTWYIYICIWFGSRPKSQPTIVFQTRRLKIKLYFYAAKNYFSPHRRSIEKVTWFFPIFEKDRRTSSLHSNILSEAVHGSHKVLILSKITNRSYALRTRHYNKSSWGHSTLSLRFRRDEKIGLASYLFVLVACTRRHNESI